MIACYSNLAYPSIPPMLCHDNTHRRRCKTVAVPPANPMVGLAGTATSIPIDSHASGDECQDEPQGSLTPLLPADGELGAA